jgi:UDP-N-acetylmuramyl pentapeptide phosphotransferase/UDP-N-acetylglucosamine-1-phosphate transferase
MIAAAAGAFVVSWLIVVAIEQRAAMVGLLDVPNNRSSHVETRPRGGGIGIVAGAFVGLLVALFAEDVLDGPLAVVLLAALVVAAVGVRDDMASIGPAPRLAAQTAAAALVVWTCGGLLSLPLPAPLDVPLGVVGTVLAVIWIVGVTNFFNFMDGADGLAAGQACLTLAALAVVLWPMPAATAALVTAAATAAFLLRNWSPARIFLGDVGSGWLGFVLAALPLAGPIGRRGDLVLLVATSLALFLVDPAVTLIRRWWRGERLTASHREHVYQRLFTPGESHARVVGTLLAVAASLTMLAVLAYWQPRAAWWSVAWAGMVCAAEWVAARHIARRRAPGVPLPPESAGLDSGLAGGDRR